jgi:hypothetical protein
VLQEAYGLEDAGDCAGAMVFNGGVAWRGSICGVISGAAIAVGGLAAQRVSDHRRAKRIARCIMDRWIETFQAAYGSLNCRDLIGQEIHTEEQHASFIASGVWRDTCMQQIEVAVQGLFSLRDMAVWTQVVSQIERDVMPGERA